jgi:crossover junction endodeoxyribonuclease RuvC
MVAIIGLDPGVSGAVAVIRNKDDDHPLTFDMPRVAGKGHLDTDHLFELLSDMKQRFDPDQIVIENVHAAPRQGVSSAFKFGETLGVAKALASALRLDPVLVTPVTWKRQLGLTGDQRGKDEARKLAGKLYPGCVFARKKDHNRAEALLIAHWGLYYNV